MKKLVLLISLFSLLAAQTAPNVYAAYDCDWNIGKTEKGVFFCYAGFASEQDLRNTKTEFQCTSNCGAVSGLVNNILSGGQPVQTSDNAVGPVGPDPRGNGFYSCSGGGFDKSVIEATRAVIGNSSNVCGAMGLTFGVPIIVGASLSLPLTILVTGPVLGTAGITAVQQCLAIANQYHPTIQGRVVDKATGKVLCSSNLPINIDANRQITAAGDTSGIKKGTVIQGGIGLQFCALDGKQGIQTALGCIPTDPSAFIGRLLTIGIGIAGGIAFLLILFGGFQILTSAGNPEHLNAGKELVSSAIAGLLLIIFSVFILRLIGVDILGIPDFK